ncbi:MAG: CopG family transcriptional regulator [Candidatus Woykebacteria bacterium]
MKRTQLYLPEKTLKILKKEAAETKRSVSEIVRETLDERLRESRGNPARFLVDMALRAERLGYSGPVDLAEKHDEYLYGKKSPKWGYLYKNKKKKK